MSEQRQQRQQALMQFLRGIQKPGKNLDTLGLDEGMVQSGHIDSLSIVQIVVYLENTYGIDFSARGLDPERLASIAGILDFIEEAA